MIGFQDLQFSSDSIALQNSFLTAISAARQSDPIRTIHVLIPNYYVAAHLRHQLAEKRALVNLRFITMRDLAKFTLRTDENFLTKVEMPADMELFQIGKLAADVSTKKGFHQNLRKLFHHLISQGANKIPHINEKAKAFDQVFQKYLELKKNYYQDPWLIEAASRVDMAATSTLYIFGFTQFSPLEMKWMNQLSKSAEINLWLERRFFEDLQEQIFTWAGSAFKTVREVGTKSRTSETSVQPASNIQDEATWIAQTILNRQKTNPLPFHRIGIFLNDYHKQKTYIENTFQKYNIPFVVYGGRPLITTPMGRAMASLTDILFQNWKRNQWIQFLQTFPFKPNLFETCGTPVQWNEWTIQAEITDKNTFFIERLEHFVKTNSKLSKTKQGSGPAKQFILWQKELVSSLEQVEKLFFKNIPLFFQKLFEWIQTYADPAAIQDEHAIFFDDLIYLSKVLDDPNLSYRSLGEGGWSEIKPIILDKLQSPAVQDKVFESDGVFVAPVSILPGLSFDMTFLPHMNEGCFPKPSVQAFDLTSHEMFLITQKSGVTFPSAEQDFEMQKALFETAPYRTHKLLISYAHVSLPSQEELRPSVFLHDMPTEKPFVNQAALPSSKVFNEAFSENIRKYNDAFHARTWSHYNALISNPAKKTIYSSGDIKNYLHCPRQYYLSKVLQLSVEDYPEDRFEIDPLDRGTLIHDILFNTFSRLRAENLFPLDKKNEEKIIQVAQTIAIETLDRFMLTHAYGSEEMWKIDREELLSDITQYMKHEIKEGKYWIPYAMEYRFGMNSHGDGEDPLSTEKPMKLRVGDKELDFRGKVDRIDLSPDRKHMRIVDYKTGKFKFKNWNYEKGTNLQVPLYMLLSKTFFPEITPTRVEGALVHIKTFSKFDRRVLPHESLANAEEKILETLELVDTGINEGKFFPNPGYSRSNCRLCDFASFCGENIDRDIEAIPMDEFMNSYQSKKDAIK